MCFCLYWKMEYGKIDERKYGIDFTKEKINQYNKLNYDN